MNFSIEEYKTIIRALINENNRLTAELKDTSANSKPASEISKLKLFMEIFNALSGQDKNDVNIERFISELVSTGRFTEDDAKTFVRRSRENGEIYERRSGYFAKV